ncbi:unnamed protein product, partial [Medioppia subpectinata]
MECCISSDDKTNLKNYPNLYEASKMTKTASNQSDITIQTVKKLTTRAQQDMVNADPNTSPGVIEILSHPYNAVDKITDNVYVTGVGGMIRENIVGLKISCIINATYEVPNYDVKGLECIRVPIDDTVDDDISLYLEEVADKLNEVVSENRGVIVHCVAGISRSSSLVLAYLVKYQKMTLKEAFIHCKTCRELSQPNIGFFKSLIEFEKQMFGKTSVQIMIKEINGQNQEIPDIYEELFPEMKCQFGQQLPTYVIIEARFNDTVLTSDAILITTSDPELKTELCFQVDRRQLHLFRIQRKPIKLQAFVVNSDSMDRQLIGYAVIDLRNAKNYSFQPKYEWKTLLNPKYKGSSSRRPQISIALLINRLDDNQLEDNINQEIDRQLIGDNESIESISSKKSSSSASGFEHNLGFDSEFNNESDVENDIKIRFKDGFHHIWDEKHFSESDCNLNYNFSVTIAFGENLSKLLVNSQQTQTLKPFHFRYSFLGTTVKTKPFHDINSCDSEIERMAFNILTTDRNTLSVYFQLHQTIEIQFCDHFDMLLGFVAISLSQFTIQTKSSFKPIEGSFMLLPDNETIDISDPFPIVGVSIELKTEEKSSVLPKPVAIETETKPLKSGLTKREKDGNNTKNKSEEKEPKELDLNHYCFAIDLRNIRVIDSDIPQIDSCYLQFLYAFFGFTDSIKTFPSIKLSAEEEVVIPHGFCAFNFATTQPKLDKTFKEIPLIIEMIEETTIHTITGVAKVDLSTILGVKPNKADAKQVVNMTVPVITEQNKPLAQIQIIMFLQNYGKTKIPLLPNLPEVSHMKGADSLDADSSQTLHYLNDLMTETALEIELWKEKQLILFRERLKQNETEFLKQLEQKQSLKEEEVKKKLQDLTQLETKLLNSLEELTTRENDILMKENGIELKQKEINLRYERLNEEIAEVMSDLKNNYEQRITSEKNKSKEVESEKYKIQEKVYSLERKVKEKENIIKELEEKLKQSIARIDPNKQKTTSVKTTRNINTTTPKAVVVTREPSFSSRPISAKTTKSPIFSRTSTPLKPNLKPVLSNEAKNNTNKV